MGLICPPNYGRATLAANSLQRGHPFASRWHPSKPHWELGELLDIHRKGHLRTVSRAPSA